MRINDLEKKLDNSGIDGNPVITDLELREISEWYSSVESYFSDSGQTVVSSYLASKKRTVDSILFHRNFWRNPPVFENHT